MSVQIKLFEPSNYYKIIGFDTDLNLVTVLLGEGVEMSPHRPASVRHVSELVDVEAVDAGG